MDCSRLNSFEASPNMGVSGVSYIASAIEIPQISHRIIKAGKSLYYFNEILLSQVPNEHKLPLKKHIASFVFCLPCCCFSSSVGDMPSEPATKKREIPIAFLGVGWTERPNGNKTTSGQHIIYPVILKILGFFSSSLSRKIHHPWLLSSPIITG